MTLSETSFPARDRLNDRLVRQVRYTGPASYAAGGDPIASADLGALGMGNVYPVVGDIGTVGAGEIRHVGGAVSTAVRVLHFDYANQKLQWFIPNTGAEVAAAVDLSGFSGVLTFYGKG